VETSVQDKQCGNSLTLRVMFVEVGACGIRRECLFLQLTGLNRLVGNSFRTRSSRSTVMLKKP
jgi:hypothetical protein